MLIVQSPYNTSFPYFAQLYNMYSNPHPAGLASSLGGGGGGSYKVAEKHYKKRKKEV